MTDFEALYQTHRDPWNVRSSWYERRKRDIVLACLARQSYGKALELGCGTGELSIGLAQRCEQLCAIDLSPTALNRCRAALSEAQISHVHPQLMQVPDNWPADTQANVELIVVSELAYYLRPPDFDRLLERCMDSLAPQGEWLMCHYLPDFHDRLQDTVGMHQRITEHCNVAHVTSHRDELFQLDIWRKPGQGKA